MSKGQLVLEILSGPLDGHKVTIDEETNWSKSGEGPLIFPWDTELGVPQARFFNDRTEWCLEGFKTQHGTYRFNRKGREHIETAVKLKQGNILKASETWLMVSKMN